MSLNFGGLKAIREYYEIRALKTWWHVVYMHMCVYLSPKFFPILIGDKIASPTVS